MTDPDDTSFDVDAFEADAAQQAGARKPVVRLGESPTVEKCLRIAERNLGYEPKKLREFARALAWQDGESRQDRRRRLIALYNRLFCPPRPARWRKDTDE